MADETHNDNEPSRASGLTTAPDAHGEAALLLVESLLHALTERSIISLAEAVEVVETASEVKAEAATEVVEQRANHTSIALLEAISASLRFDL